MLKDHRDVTKAEINIKIIMALTAQTTRSYEWQKQPAKGGELWVLMWIFFLRVLLSCWASPKQEVSVILAEEEFLSPTLEGKQRMWLLRLTYLSIQSGLLTILPGRQGACKAEWNRTLRCSSKKTEWKGYLQWLKKSKSVLFICPLAPLREAQNLFLIQNLPPLHCQALSTCVSNGEWLCRM